VSGVRAFAAAIGWVLAVGCGPTGDRAAVAPRDRDALGAPRPPRLWSGQSAARPARNPFRPLLTEPPANPPPPPPADAAPAPPPRVALVAIVEISDGLRAMLEQQPGGATRFVRVGEEAFGFRVIAIERDRAILEREGVQIELRPTASPAAPPSSTAAPRAVPDVVARHLPPGAEVLDWRSETVEGEMRYFVRWRSGSEGPARDAEARFDARGALISLTVEQRHDELPPSVLAAALRAEPDARIAADVPPRLREEAGRRHYEITLRDGAGRAIVLHLAPDGTRLDRR